MKISRKIMFVCLLVGGQAAWLFGAPTSSKGRAAVAMPKATAPIRSVTPVTPATITPVSVETASRPSDIDINALAPSLHMLFRYVEKAALGTSTSNDIKYAEMSLKALEPSLKMLFEVDRKRLNMPKGASAVAVSQASEKAVEETFIKFNNVLDDFNSMNWDFKKGLPTRVAEEKMIDAANVLLSTGRFSKEDIAALIEDSLVESERLNSDSAKAYVHDLMIEVGQGMQSSQTGKTVFDDAVRNLAGAMWNIISERPAFNKASLEDAVVRAGSEYFTFQNATAIKNTLTQALSAKISNKPKLEAYVTELMNKISSRAPRMEITEVELQAPPIQQNIAKLASLVNALGDNWDMNNNRPVDNWTETAVDALKVIKENGGTARMESQYQAIEGAIRRKYEGQDDSDGKVAGYMAELYDRVG